MSGRFSFANALIAVINLILFRYLSDWGIASPVRFFNDWFRVLLRYVHG